MNIEGKLLIGHDAIRGSAGEIFAMEAATGIVMQPSFGTASADDIERVLERAWTAFALYRNSAAGQRAALLRAIATEMEGLGDALIDRAILETGLTRARLEGERTRTCTQLRMFAAELETTDPADMRFDAADHDRRPPPRPELRSRRVGLGPVVVFGASNFPLAFSVAGSDTASALAAGCPVIVKAHSAHLGTADLVGQAVQKAAVACRMPDGVFSLVFAGDRKIGEALVADQRVRAVGFTGSRAGGMALMKTAQGRRRPIPVYAEMSSINPVILFPDALRKRAERIGPEFIASLTLGAGQFCTNPGIVLGVDGPDLDRFVKASAEALSKAPAQTMLTAGIADAYSLGIDHLSHHPAVRCIGVGLAGQERQRSAALFETDGASVQAYPDLQDEVFGAAGLIVRCRNLQQIEEILRQMEGQLTVAVHVGDGDRQALGAMMLTIEDLCGRILVDGFGTGVELSRAMVHGGPYPSTSDGRTTSVGTMAVERFLRPICYQNFTAGLLPAPFAR